MTMQEEHDRHLHPEEEVDEGQGAEHEPVDADAPTTSRGPVPHGDPEKSQGSGGGKPSDPALSRTRRRNSDWRQRGLVLAVAGFVGYGVNQRGQRNQAAQQELDNRRNRVPELRIEKVKAVDTPRGDPSSGDDAGFRCRDHFRPAKRVHLSAPCGHWKPGQEWRSPGCHFGAGGRRPAHAGAVAASADAGHARTKRGDARARQRHQQPFHAARAAGLGDKQPATRTAIISLRRTPPSMWRRPISSRRNPRSPGSKAAIVRARRGALRWGDYTAQHRYRQSRRCRRHVRHSAFRHRPRQCLAGSRFRAAGCCGSSSRGCRRRSMSRSFKAAASPAR